MLATRLKDALELIPKTVSEQDGQDSVALTQGNIHEALAAARRLSDVSPKLQTVPVRTVHHLSCTGGTLVSKCIASMANTLVLNEVDFQSPIPSRNGFGNFAPTDAVSLLRQGDNDVGAEEIANLFADTVATLRHREWRRGRDLVLRDHTHSYFLWGEEVRDGPTMKEILETRFPVRALVTIRDPIDTFASIVKNEWHTHFRPSTFDEFCRRHLLFLKSYRDVPIIKYEAFVSQPKQIMKEICRVLELDYFEQFTGVFDSFDFSGDSGRSSGEISPRPRSEAAEALKEEARASRHYSDLISETGYTPI